MRNGGKAICDKDSRQARCHVAHRIQTRELDNIAKEQLREGLEYLESSQNLARGQVLLEHFTEGAARVPRWHAKVGGSEAAWKALGEDAH